jgi:GT2 family glycosyltransferase
MKFNYEEPKSYAVIVTFFPKEDVLSFVKTLLSQGLQVVVVDNNSGLRLL